MARPRSFDTETVLSQVTDLFWAEGFGGVSIADIAQVTGLRPGSIHAAFGNKDDLFALAFQRYDEHFQACLNAAPGGLDGIRSYLDTLVSASIDDPDRRGCLIINTAVELETHGEATRTAVEEKLDEMKTFFRDRLIEEGIRSEQAVHGLFGAAVSILTLARAGQPEGVLRDIAASATNAAELSGSR